MKTRTGHRVRGNKITRKLTAPRQPAPAGVTGAREGNKNPRRGDGRLSLPRSWVKEGRQQNKYKTTALIKPLDMADSDLGTWIGAAAHIKVQEHHDVHGVCI
eukprot:1061122-Rhodomonas_salina.3